ncbi:hypothetical protein [Peribacillus sp. NPDC097295]|uniref:hypothetical protein n=1 Tax=Peribacillus sp. NPDC097295 TaxID=3364402 RepID=UPI00382F28BE
MNKRGVRLKKIYKFLLGLLIVVGMIYGYVQYKFNSVESSVIEFLTVNEDIPERSFTSEPFISNLPGDRNRMVFVKIDGDPIKYTYYLNEQKQIVLESYIKNGEVEVVNTIMN